MTARRVIESRSCESCGSALERRRFPSGQLERVSQFAERRFCSRECFRKASADGRRLRPVGVEVPQPYGLFSSVSVSADDHGGSATGRGYPWDRQRHTSPGALPVPFPASGSVSDRREP